MTKFVSMEEAAKLLGVSTEKLNEMRQAGKVHALRDGQTWKFREDEVQRVASAGDDSSVGLGSRLDDGGSDSVLSDEPDENDAGSTIVGRSAPPDAAAEESDLQLALKDDVPTKKPNMSDVIPAFDDIDEELQPELGGSHVTLGDDGGGSGVRSGSESGNGNGSNVGVGGDSDVDKGNITLENKGPISEIDLAEMSDLDLTSTSDIDLSAADSDVNLEGVSSIDLADDDNLVLSSSESDVTLGSGDSGISLLDPSDTGLSLEEPLELGGSSVDSFELGEASGVSLDAGGDTESPTQLKADDDFLLQPLESDGDDSDSGSQVIALDEDEAFGAGATSTLDDEPLEVEDEYGRMPVGAAEGAPHAYAAPELPYSIWNVLSLFVCIVFLMVGGMFTYDLIRNMWGWNQAYEINSTLMDAILSWFE